MPEVRLGTIPSEAMGFFRRILEKLFDPPSVPVDQIVFERLDDAEVPVEGPRGIRVSLEELLPGVPQVWLRQGGWSAEQTIEIPREAFMESSAERPSVASLRFLASAYPLVFRDPGATVADCGVDVPMARIRDRAAEAESIPADVLVESSQQRQTFSEWEGELPAAKERATEARETAVALRGVRMPAPVNRGETFESALVAQGSRASDLPVGGESGVGASAVGEVGRSESPVSAANPRLRRILEAYVDSSQPRREPVEEVVRVKEPEAAPIFSRGSGGVKDDPLLDSMIREALSVEAAGASVMDVSAEGQRFTVDAYKMRFDELGLSLSRFPEVRGFAFWQAGQAAHTGDLGFELELGALRLRLERMLEGAVQVQGVQDGFSSVTLHHAKGGVSVFGNGTALVAVAHQPEGLPGHLRAWMCGWVSQPLRS